MAKIATSLSSKTTLNDGVEMPMFGLGTYVSKGNDLGESCVVNALNHGYRLLDSAAFYENEREIGNAVRSSGIKREEIFVVTKVDFHHFNGHGREEVKKSFKTSLEKLGLEYVDLYLIHTPTPGKLIDTYTGMLELKEQGLIRSVGVSNFNIHHLEGLKKAGLPTPSVNQIENHVKWHKNELVDYCRQQGITVMGFSPLARAKLFEDDKLKQLAEKYGKSVAQIMIRWSVQRGLVTIPKSTDPDRIVENTKVFDWSLEEEDFNAITNDPKEVSILSGSPLTTAFID